MIARRLAWLPAIILLLVGMIGLWRPPPADVRPWQVISYLIFGGGFAVAGAVASRGCRPGVWVPLLSGGTTLLAAQVLAGIGATSWSDLLAATALAVLLPVGVLQVPERDAGRVVLAVMDGVVVTCGLATVVAVAAGATTVAASIGLAAGCVVFCMVWLQFELTSGDSRRQVLWIVLGGSVAALPVLLATFVGDARNLGPDTIAFLFGVLALPLPAAVTVAAVDPRITDVRRAISRTAVFGVMLVLVVAAFGGGSALVLLLNGGRQPVLGVSAALCALIAAAYHPVRGRVQVTMDTLLFGGRADALDVLTRLGSAFSAGSQPQEWLDSLRSGIAVPGISLRALPDGRLTVSGSVIGSETWSLTLRAGGEEVGELVVALPAEQLRLAPTTRAVLELVAGPLARALQAIRLADELRVSRGRVVAALEEERRRLRRDLHDGLGPTLTGIAYSADAAANLVRPDPDQAEQLLRALRSDTADAIAEIRRIVEGLRPRDRRVRRGRGGPPAGVQAARRRRSTVGGDDRCSGAAGPACCHRGGGLPGGGGGGHQRRAALRGGRRPGRLRRPGGGAGIEGGRRRPGRPLAAGGRVGVDAGTGGTGRRDPRSSRGSCGRARPGAIAPDHK